jgi:hypothetical protein
MATTTSPPPIVAQSLYVPEIGDQLTLAQDWTFGLHYEYRNEKLWAALGLARPVHSLWGHPPVTAPVTIPAGTVLTVDRLYIRKGAAAYSSLTFNIPKGRNPGHPLAGTRFWAKLADVNRLLFTTEAPL